MVAQTQLHPLQQAFLAEDALQCGYCTPGFLIEGISFCDLWRKKHGKVKPEREIIAEALSGHLCRCGAYEGIYRAIERTCLGEFDKQLPLAPRSDGLPKVKGTAKYTSDIQLEGMLHAVILRSPYGHARINSINFKKAKQHNYCRCKGQ